MFNVASVILICSRRISKDLGPCAIASLHHESTIWKCKILSNFDLRRPFEILRRVHRFAFCIQTMVSWFRIWRSCMLWFEGSPGSVLRTLRFARKPCHESCIAIQIFFVHVRGIESEQTCHREFLLLERCIRIMFKMSFPVLGSSRQRPRWGAEHSLYKKQWRKTITTTKKTRHWRQRN